MRDTITDVFWFTLFGGLLVSAELLLIAAAYGLAWAGLTVFELARAVW